MKRDEETSYIYLQISEWSWDGLGMPSGALCW